MIDRRRREVALLVGGCLFMEMLDASIVTTSAPRMARSLSVSPADIGLTITVYVVTLAALIPVSGWMSAGWGPRRVFLAAIALFALGSLGCGLSDSLTWLIAMRIVQAAGGALMVPVGRLVVLRDTAKHELLTVTAYLVWPALVAPVIAPLLGGFITTYANWHWLFFINLPLAAIAFGVAVRVIEHIPAVPTPPLDVLGLLLIFAALAGLTGAAGVVSAGSSWAIAGLALLASLAAGAFGVRHLTRTPHPLIGLETLRIPTFSSAVGGSFIFLVCAQAAPFLLPLLFQEVFGWSPVKSGALILVIFAGVIVSKPATTWLYRRLGFRVMLVSCTFGLAATMGCCGLLRESTPIAAIAVLLFVSGVARSVAGTGYVTVAFSDIAPAQMQDANTLQTTLQHLSQGFGVASGTVALRLAHPLAHLFGGGLGSSGRYTAAFLLLSCVALTGTVWALRMDPGAGDALRPPRTRPDAAHPARPGTDAPSVR
jgi:EmrB/QacA subfamily drug resistance transporter